LKELYSFVKDKIDIFVEPALTKPSTYEMNLYGHSTLSEITFQILDSLNNSLDIGSKYNYLINTDSNELLITQTFLQNSNKFHITNDTSNYLLLYILSNDSKIQCELSDINNFELSNEVSRLLSKIRLINWCIYEINGIFQNVPNEIPKYEGLPVQDQVHVASKRLSGQTFIQNYNNSKITEIQNCLRKRNVFILKEKAAHEHAS
jgi:hypothetical protein